MEILLAVAEALQGSIFEIGVLAVFLVVAIIVFFASRNISKTEAFKQIEAYLPIIDSGITQFIRQVANDDIDVPYESERAEQMGIDPRMLWVLEKMEVYTKRRGLKIELDELYLLAQDIYDSMVDNGKLD